MVDYRSIEDSKQREAEYTQNANEAQEAINNIDANEAQRQQEEPSKNIFTVMKKMFERKKAEGELDKKTRQYVKNEYEDKIREARQQRLIQETEAKMETKLTRARMTSKEKAIRIKEKLSAFGNKLATNLSGSSTGSSGRDIFSSASVDRMLGKQSQQQPGKGGVRQTPVQNDPFNADKLMRYAGGTRGPSGGNAAKMLGGSKGPAKGSITSYLGGNSVGKKSPVSYLSSGNVGKRDYVADFGSSGGVNVNKFLGTTPASRTYHTRVSVTKKKGKGKKAAATATTAESSEAKIRRMLG